MDQEQVSQLDFSEQVNRSLLPVCPSEALSIPFQISYIALAEKAMQELLVSKKKLPRPSKGLLRADMIHTGWDKSQEERCCQLECSQIPAVACCWLSDSVQCQILSAPQQSRCLIMCPTGLLVAPNSCLEAHKRRAYILPGISYSRSGPLIH